MKNLILTLTVFLFSLFATAAKNAPFQGQIIYEITYEGEGSDYMQMIGFNKYHYCFGEKKVRLTLAGGMAYLLNDFIVDLETDKTVMIDDQEKVVYTIDNTDEETEEVVEAENSLVVKTKDKEKILGYKCTKYVLTETTDSSETITEYWTTPKIMVNSFGEINFVNGLTYPGVDGFPLRIVVKVGGFTMTQEATDIYDDPVDIAVFEIPTTYAIKDFSESPLMQLIDEETEEE